MNELYIGNNLDIMNKLDDETIDVIFTDPPYNTTNAKLTYNDNRSDQDWLDFMEPRIIQCHRLLKKTGTMLMHIDQKMHAELQLLIYKVFDKKNYITTFVWKKRSSTSSQSKFATIEHEYIIAVAKNKNKCKWNGIPQFEPKDRESELKVTGNAKSSYRPNQHYPLYYNKTDGYGEYREEHHNLIGGKNSKESSIKSMCFPLHISETKISLTPFLGSIEVFPMNGKELGCWRCIPATCQKLIDADMLIVKNGKIYQKQYANFQFNKKTCQLETFIRTTPISTILLGDKYPSNLRSNKEIKEIYGKTVFPYVKPVDLVKNLLKVVSSAQDIVLDIFAGSGTTGVAAHQLQRQFILVQIDEGGIPELTKVRLDKEIGKDNYEIIERKI